jgi:hypothetical protein
LRRFCSEEGVYEHPSSPESASSDGSFGIPVEQKSSLTAARFLLHVTDSNTLTLVSLPSVLMNVIRLSIEKPNESNQHRAAKILLLSAEFQNFDKCFQDQGVLLLHDASLLRSTSANSFRPVPYGLE